MGLFAKKDTDGAAATKPAKAPKAAGAKKGLSFGRKKDAPAAAPAAAPPDAGGFEDFSDFSEEALTSAAPADDTTAKPKKVKVSKPPRKEKKGLRGGAVVGLNIGNDSIKAVEVKGKGTNVVVTAMGMIPTPPESIANGVVMSTTALAHAIRDLFKKSGIKTKRVITSVAGTGALVVRVIEVPRMSDNELKDNMAVDVDRYIPFPPSEVILDFKALRDLPSDPDDPNMEVLLAAAQREIVDLHVNVLMSAKLEPQAIDVEPLAAARSLAYDALSERNADNGTTNYEDISALINIGATNTEISVLRGDILVFTRSVPRGGNALSEALAMQLDLMPADAERLKCEVGDALPPHGAVQASAPLQSTPDLAPLSAAPHSDDFAGFDEAFGDVDDTTVSDGHASAEDWASFDDIADATPVAVETPPAAPAPVVSLEPAQPAAPPANVDPFDLDFFNQGPQGNEPQEQHQQKQDDDHPFDFSDFTLEEARAAADNLLTHEGTLDDDYSTYPTHEGAAAGEAASASPESAPPNQDWNSAIQPDEAAPTGRMFHFDAIDDPSLPSFPALPTHLTPEPALDDFSSLPSIIEESDDSPAIAETTPTAQPAEPAAPDIFSFDSPLAAPVAAETSTDLAAPLSNDALAEFAGIPMPQSEVENAAPVQTAPGLSFSLVNEEPAAPVASSVPSAFDFSDLDAAPAAPPVAETTTPAGAVSDGSDILDLAGVPVDETGADDFDIDSILGPDAQSADATADIFGADAAGATDDFDASAFGSASTTGFDDDFGDMQDFGAALSGSGATAGIGAEQVHEVLAPLLDELVGEVRRSLEYFVSRYPDSGVRRITLVGGGAKLTNIDAYFTQALGIPTTRGNAFAGVVVRAPQLASSYVDENSPLYAVALGLALRDVA